MKQLEIISKVRYPFVVSKTRAEIKNTQTDFVPKEGFLTFVT